MKLFYRKLQLLEKDHTFGLQILQILIRRLHLPLRIWKKRPYLLMNFQNTKIDTNLLHYHRYSVLSSVVFFVVSNFGVWVMGGYTYDFSGFVACYVMAVPFFKNTLLSTVIFSLLFHYSFKFLSSFEKQTVNTTA